MNWLGKLIFANKGNPTIMYLTLCYLLRYKFLQRKPSQVATYKILLRQSRRYFRTEKVSCTTQIRLARAQVCTWHSCRGTPGNFVRQQKGGKSNYRVTFKEKLQDWKRREQEHQNIFLQMRVELWHSTRWGIGEDFQKKKYIYRVGSNSKQKFVF